MRGIAYSPTGAALPPARARTCVGRVGALAGAGVVDAMAPNGMIGVTRDLVAGTLGGCAGITFGQPLDTIKVRLQARPGHFRGMTDCALRTVRLEGVRGLFKGLIPPLIGNAPLNALLFATDGAATRTLSAYRGVAAAELNTGDQALCGASAGFVACFVMSPTELIKCQLQVQMGSENALGASGCVRALIAESGFFGGLYRGFCVTALRDTPSYALYFCVYKKMKSTWSWLLGVDGSHERGGAISSRETAATLMAGGLAGMSCWAAIYPIDVVKSNVQSMAINTARRDRRMLTVAADLYLLQQPIQLASLSLSLSLVVRIAYMCVHGAGTDAVESGRS